ncbi:MAG: GH92 family glycosyl hydrolase [Prevotella sp.]|nr:GH92 family glycosyl hydrolase [Prevotella sp.]
MTRARTSILTILCCLCLGLHGQDVCRYVNPRIGSEGVGRTFPGPSMPFGMVKPGPDCGVKPNAGWAPMPEPVTGFSQTHVSGTGGGQKYGNILIQPMVDDVQEQLRTEETILLGYYATTYANGIRTEVTTAERCAFYRIHYPEHGQLLVDATHYLGKSDIPDLREAQQFVGADLEVFSDTEVRGYSTIRGGWNNGDAYTVYFALASDKPFTAQTDPSHQKTKLSFIDSCVNVRVGISFVSTMQARRNIVDVTFEQQKESLLEAWRPLLSKVTLRNADEKSLRMFYTALYHTMLMPVDRSGENPKWSDTPYYDDYYAIWDTYRTSSPLLILIAPDRQRDIIHSMLNIYRREGYLPEGRSGNCNGRTQGGSNAEVVLADAYVKHLDGIDYEWALEAMLKDATVPPGGNEEKEGRGGLAYYNTLGYIPYGVDRAGNRTIEYALDDHCIATVAEGLGFDDVAAEYSKKATNWKNLWRKDYEYDGMRGFVMPRDANGQWLDSVPWGHSKVFHPRIHYTPTTKVAPWYLPWWSTFFYEATSEEYSLSVPHDVLGLVEACGGDEAFRKRLDLFFERNYYNVANEPSFLTPCLYHWIGRPDLSTRRVHDIINKHYGDTPDGLPGNDDSGAMSSWLAFHMMGLYPNAGHDYYLLNLPLFDEGYQFLLPNGNILQVETRGKGTDYSHATLNGVQLADARITHDQLLGGGKLVYWKKKPVAETAATPPSSIPATRVMPKSNDDPASIAAVKGEISYTLNKQFRTWPITMTWRDDVLCVKCKEASYLMSFDTVSSANGFCWDSPQVDGAFYEAKGTFGFISRQAFNHLLNDGWFVYDDITWRETSRTEDTITVRADIDRTEMTISRTLPLPLVLKMHRNPLGIDWNLNVYE